jgi:hypothetical protein
LAPNKVIVGFFIAGKLLVTVFGVGVIFIHNISGKSVNLIFLTIFIYANTKKAATAQIFPQPKPHTRCSAAATSHLDLFISCM